jgi:hypothetical protein
VNCVSVFRETKAEVENKLDVASFQKLQKKKTLYARFPVRSAEFW